MEIFLCRILSIKEVLSVREEKIYEKQHRSSFERYK
jgi:hypothetical protein